MPPPPAPLSKPYYNRQQKAWEAPNAVLRRGCYGRLAADRSPGAECTDVNAVV